MCHTAGSWRKPLGQDNLSTNSAGQFMANRPCRTAQMTSRIEFLCTRRLHGSLLLLIHSFYLWVLLFWGHLRFLVKQRDDTTDRVIITQNPVRGSSVRQILRDTLGSWFSREVTKTEVTTRKTQFAVRRFAKFLGTPWVLASAER